MLNYDDVLIIPDIHEKYKKVKKLLDIYEPNVDFTVFLGDWFDKWGPTDLNSVKHTAKLLDESLSHPKRKILDGNHDLPYKYPCIKALQCSGNDFQKLGIINKYVSADLWKNSRFYIWINNWLCSHAGTHPFFYTSINELNSKDEIIDAVQCGLLQMQGECWANLEADNIHPFVSPGAARGGWNHRGGITWLDFNSEFLPIPYINQIVGHTQGSIVREKMGLESENYCIDTDLNTIAILHGPIVEFIDVSGIDK